MDETKNKIKHLAKREGTSAKETVMRLVEQAIAQDAIDVPAESFLSGIEEIIGSVEGPADLASSPKHMEGFGR